MHEGGLDERQAASNSICNLQAQVLGLQRRWKLDAVVMTAKPWLKDTQPEPLPSLGGVCG